ncbi:Por secretion system C-terminal sorting domain-containing protein [Nonlabens sp. Hel1_33_55]|uniref:type IX secretion system anionic LPS delivery protein PorZ n=1 Tax=Nonlabens sp. Hel1_33_55 TaxID=1336802 RepID=UPI000875D125|nr:T9SS type A sorting domain-containing protein [Nonlabens sp. Hel1_33_55]SCY28767.1 Por secretion system C-terminal sorting domain-containing protein [Nonlabens sp. Hel1_33_55]
MKFKLILFLLIAGMANAQDFTNQWTGLFSFNQIIDIEQTDQRIYAASENAVFVYEIASRTFNTITTVNGLSGDEISQIIYRESDDQLVIGYENGLLQIVQDDEVLDVVAIRDKQVIDPDRKRINEFKANGELLYIATDFGIAIYDLDRLEFNDTYFIGENGAQLRVRSIEIFDGFLYAATNDAGIRRADISDPFLIDFTNWNQLNMGAYDEVTALETQIFAIDTGGTLFRLTGDIFTNTGYRFPSRTVDATVSGNELSVTGAGYLQILDANENLLNDIRNIDGGPYRFTAGNSNSNSIYVGTLENGMIRLNRQNTVTPEFIVADGPTRNRAFSLTTAPNTLWVGYGDYSLLYNPFPLEQFGVSRLIEDEWTNFTPDDVLNINSISSIAINPDITDEVYLNSMHNGVLEFVDGIAETLYGIDNSSLSQIDVPGYTGPDFVRIPASEFDRQGNLWVLSSLVEDPINRRTPAGQWTSFDVSEFIPTIDGSSTTKLAITNAGNIIFGTVDNGVIAFDPNENRFGNLREEIQEGNLTGNYVSEVTLDQNEQLWIGSNRGLRVFFNANSILSENPNDARAIIIEDQNGIPRELLKDEAILDIEVDGNNRKWIATASSGAFLFSPSGQETIFQFTKDNSPLPSNGVNDIAIDNTTGQVYFATNNGIVAFQGDRSSPPSEDLENVFAFPNPVKPEFDGNVTIDGLTDRARIKITDIEGNLVFEVVSQGGSVQWDTTNFSGSRVSSGVYMLLISTDDNVETTVSKIMIIR